MVDALVREIELKADKDRQVSTVYFGGGTPSILNQTELNTIFDALYHHFDIATKAEVTLEANPDDLSMEKLAELKDTPVNRLSIGVQSFSNADLQYMNRAHKSEEALKCLKNAQQIGFTNLTVDLIYGTPGMNDEQWQNNLNTLFNLNIPHISCYALTVEPNTALAHFIEKKKTQAVDEIQAARQFDMLIAAMEANGYEHYEISNFCQPGHYSQHNTAYWQGKHYIGIGPAAHSFDGKSRSWNIANNAIYMKSIRQDKTPSETEILTETDQFNEYIMTSLRTKWGCSLGKIQTWGKPVSLHFLEAVKPFLKNGQMHQENDYFYLSNTGKFLSDGIISQLFLD